MVGLVVAAAGEIGSLEPSALPLGPFWAKLAAEEEPELDVELCGRPFEVEPDKPDDEEEEEEEEDEEELVPCEGSSALPSELPVDCCCCCCCCWPFGATISAS